MRNSLVLFLSIFFIACSSHFTTPRDGQLIQTGDSYALPRTTFTIAVKKSPDGLSYSVTSYQDRDLDFQYSLKSSSNPLFGIKHKTETSNGLLETVNSNDEGELDEILKESVGAIMAPGLLKGGVSPSGGAAPAFAASERGDVSLTAAEYAALIAQVPNGDHSFVVVPGSKFNTMTLPGSSGVLVVTVSKTGERGRARREDVDQSFKNSTKYLGRNCTADYPGVLARSVTPVSITTTLSTNPSALLKWRRGRATTLRNNKNPDSDAFLAAASAGSEVENEIIADISTNKKRIEELDLAISDLSKKLAEAAPDKQADIKAKLDVSITLRDSLAKSREALITSRGKIAGEIAVNRTKSNAIENPVNEAARLAADSASLDLEQILYRKTDRLNQADESFVVVLPMSRGLIGASKNELVLSSGIVTSNTHEVESQALAFVKIPSAIAKEIISVPASFFTLIASAATEQKSALNAKTDVIAAQEAYIKALENAKKRDDPQ